MFLVKISKKKEIYSGLFRNSEGANCACFGEQLFSSLWVSGSLKTEVKFSVGNDKGQFVILSNARISFHITLIS